MAAHPLRKAARGCGSSASRPILDGGMLTGSAYMRQPWGVSKIYAIDDPATAACCSSRTSGWCRSCGKPSSRACNSRPTASATGPCTPCSTPTKRSTRQTPIAPTRPCITHSNFMSREAIEQAARLGVAGRHPAGLALPRYADPRRPVRLRPAALLPAAAQPVRGRA